MKRFGRLHSFCRINSDFQAVCNRIGRCLLAAHVQMRVDVGRGREITVSKPELNFLEADPISQQQAGAAMPEVVETDMRHARFFDDLSKTAAYPIRVDEIAHAVHADIFQILLVVLLAAQLLVLFLLLLGVQQNLLDLGNQRERAKTGFGFRPIL